MDSDESPRVLRVVAAPATDDSDGRVGGYVQVVLGGSCPASLVATREAVAAALRRAADAVEEGRTCVETHEGMRLLDGSRGRDLDDEPYYDLVLVSERGQGT